MQNDRFSRPHATVRRRHRHAPWLLVALVTLPALFAQQANAQQRPQFRSRVELVQLQVGVADGDGAFVSGLSAEDFVVVVDGAPRPAQVAYEIDLRDKDRAGVAAVAGPSKPAASRPVAARRHFVLLFDFSFTTGRGVREARRAALEFLEQNLHPTDLVAVASVNRFGIELRVPFTNDRGKVHESVAALSLADATDRIVLEKLEDDDAGGVVLVYEEYEASVTNYVAQIERFGEMMQAIEGRKHLVMFSTGFDDRVLVGSNLESLSSQAEFRAAGSPEGVGLAGATDTAGSDEVRAGIQAAVEEFREADVVIHTVDPRGLRSERRVRNGRPGLYSPTGRQALNYLAHETGGEAYWNMNDLTPALAQIEESTARFYLIGYRKQATDAGTVDIQVRVSRPGVKITSAPERFTPPPEYVDMNAVQRQLQLAEALADDSDVRRIAVASQAVTFPAPTGGLPRVVLFLQIAGPELERLAAQRGSDEVEFEIAGFAHDNHNTLVDTFRRKVGIDVASMRASGPMAEQSFRYADSVDVPAGEGRLRLLVRESVIGELTATTQRYDAPGAEAAQHMIVVHPMIVDDRSLPPLSQQDRAFDPLQFNNRRLAPIADPQVTPGGSMDVLLVVYNAPRNPASDEITAQISIELEESASGDSYPVSDFRILGTGRTEATAATQLLVHVPIPPPVRPGDARLWVRITDPGTGNLTHEQTGLFVISR